jgi:hypothetical protein
LVTNLGLSSIITLLSAVDLAITALDAAKWVTLIIGLAVAIIALFIVIEHAITTL